MVEKILLNSSLSSKEVAVYLALFKFSYATAPQLARNLNMPRQTIYSLLQHLIELGLVDQGKRQGSKQFYTDSEKLTWFMEKQKRQASENVQLLEKELPSLVAGQKRNPALPKIQYYEGDTGLIHLFESILDFYKKAQDKKFRGYGINKFHEALGDYLYEFVKRRGQYEVSTQLFIGQGPDDFGITDKSSAYGRDVKRLDIEPQQAGMYIVGNRIYLFSFEDKVGVMIQNADMAKLLSSVFDDHWKKYK